MPSRAPRAAGFTLLELIVAVTILALIAVFSWRGLDGLIREREALAASQRKIDEVQRLFARVERDALAAGDVELSGDGSMVLLAGSAALDGGTAAAVRYRYVDGALQRTVAGVDRGPAIVLSDVGAITMEAWSPSGSGGAWVRSRAAAAPVAASGANGAAAAPSTPTPAAPGTTVGPVFPAAPAAPEATAAAPATAAPAASITATSATAASAIRLAFTRADGPPVTRTFLVGGG